MSARQLDLPLPPPPADPFPDLEDAEETPFLAEGEPEDGRALPSREETLARSRELAQAISRRLDRPVRLSVTDNRSTMVSFHRREKLLVLRVHHMFLDAPEGIVDALADYAGRGLKSASQAIDRYVRENTESIRAGSRSSPRMRLEPRGKVWNLQQIFDEVNAACFEGRISAEIGWGRAPVDRRRRTIRMGVYDHLSRTIRIHPALDRPEVPRFFVEYIVFHEMLHQAVPGAERGRRRQHHGAEFRRRERAWPGYARAIAWERENISMLLGRRTGKFARPVD